MNEAKDTEYTIIVKSNRRADKNVTGTFAYLLDYFSYTLETGYSYQDEKGNKKINRNPKNVKALVTTLEKASNNAAVNGYSGISYDLHYEK